MKLDKGLIITFLLSIIGGGMIGLDWFFPPGSGAESVDFSRFARVDQVTVDEGQLLLDLEETAEDEIETNPVLVVQFVVMDGETGALVEAEIDIGYGEIVGDGVLLDAAEYERHCDGHTCELLFTRVDPGHAYFLQVTAEGYEPWHQRLTWFAKRSTQMDIPIKLTRAVSA